MAALMLVGVMAVVVAVFVAVKGSFMAVFVAVMSMRLGSMNMLVLMLVLAVATHAFLTSFSLISEHYYNQVHPKGQPAELDNRRKTIL